MPIAAPGYPCTIHRPSIRPPPALSRRNAVCPQRPARNRRHERSDPVPDQGAHRRTCPHRRSTSCYSLPSRQSVAGWAGSRRRGPSGRRTEDHRRATTPWPITAPTRDGRSPGRHKTTEFESRHHTAHELCTCPRRARNVVSGCNAVGLDVVVCPAATTTSIRSPPDGVRVDSSSAHGALCSLNLA